VKSRLPGVVLSVLLLVGLTGGLARAARDDRESMLAMGMVAAASGNNLQVVKLFLQGGVGVDARNEEGDTALIASSRNGAEETAGYLLEKGADINARNNEGWTPLISAAWGGHRGVADLLIRNGADVNARGVHGFTALLMALANRQADAVNFFLERVPNTDFNAVAGDGETVLMKAVTMCDCRIVGGLIDRGANVKREAGARLIAFAEERCPPFLKACLVERGVDINSQLLAAARANQIDEAKALLDIGADVNARDGNGWTALMHAADRDGRALLKLLMDRGADLAALNKEGRDATSLALGKGHPEIVAAIRNAEKNRRFLGEVGNGNVPASLALLATGIDGNVKVDALMVAAERGFVEILDALLRGGTDVNARAASGNSALFFAATSMHGRSVETVDFLIGKGANVNARNNQGDTAAFALVPYCSDSRSLSILKRLIDKGLDVNVRNNGGNTLLLKSVDEIGGSEVAARILIERGADINARNGYGWTPLIAAAHSPYTDYSAIAGLLIDRGADVHAADEFGRTALSIARQQRHTRIVEMLEKAGAK
jgi:ankyrin repeat protein